MNSKNRKKFCNKNLSFEFEIISSQEQFFCRQYRQQQRQHHVQPHAPQQPQQQLQLPIRLHKIYLSQLKTLCQPLKPKKKKAWETMKNWEF